MALKGRRKHGDKNQRQASAITEEPLAMLSPFDSEETGEGATVWHDSAPPPGANKEMDIGTIEKYRDPGAEDFEHLGKLLVYLRHTYFDRIAGADSDRPRSDLKAAAVVDYLRKHRYSMTSGSYSMLEQGKTLPRNPEQFLSIISKCFQIDRSSKYWVLLRRQYVYDHTVRFVGKEYADQTILHGSALLRTMRGESSNTDPSHPAQQPVR